MKDLLATLLLLCLLVWAFSQTECPTRYDLIPKEGWAFFGDSGEPIPGDSDSEEKMDAFVVNKTEQENQKAEMNQVETEPAPPVTFTVTTEKITEESKAKAEQKHWWSTFIAGIGVGVIASCISVLTGIGVAWLRYKKKRRNKPDN